MISLVTEGEQDSKKVETQKAKRTKGIIQQQGISISFIPNHLLHLQRQRLQR